jgi:hypothetical protein
MPPVRRLPRILLNAPTAASLVLWVLAGCTAGTQPREPSDDRTMVGMIRAQDERRGVDLVRRWQAEGYRGERDDTWAAEDRRAIGAARQLWESSGLRGADADEPLFLIERTGARQIVTIVWLDREERGGVRVTPGWGLVHVEVFADGRPPRLLPSV